MNMENGINLIENNSSARSFFPCEVMKEKIKFRRRHKSFWNFLEPTKSKEKGKKEENKLQHGKLIPKNNNNKKLST